MTAYANVLSFVTAFPLMSLIIQDDHYAHYHRRPFPHKARLAAYRAGMLGRKPTRCPRSQVAGNHSDLLCAGSAARRSGGDSDSAAVASAASGRAGAVTSPSVAPMPGGSCQAVAFKPPPENAVASGRFPCRAWAPRTALARMRPRSPAGPRVPPQRPAPARLSARPEMLTAMD